jgi:hypothetical protein
MLSLPDPSKIDWANQTSAVWPEANLAIYYPFSLSAAATVRQLFLLNGATVSGNIDLGIYAEDGTKLVAKGSTAQAGTTNVQGLDITDSHVGPGRFYIGVALDNVTATTRRSNTTTVQIAAPLGILMQSTAFPLPATATFATMIYGYFPLVGISFFAGVPL